jgi:ribosomal protein S27E
VSALVAFTCGECGAVLGQSSGRRLYIGPTVFARTVSIHCAGCGRRRVWVPVAPTGESRPADLRTDVPRFRL